jgi:hypothetical protein
VSKEAKIRKALKLYRSILKLDEEHLSLGFRDLDKPVQQGWILTFRLSDEYNRRADQTFWTEMLNLIQNTFVSPDKMFMERSYSSKSNKSKWKRHKLQPKSLSECEYDKLHWKQKKHFNRVLRNRYSWGTFKKDEWVYEIKTNFLSEKVEPNMVTRVPIKSSQIDSELKELWNKIDSNGYWGLICREMGWSTYDDWGHEGKERKLKEDKMRIDKLIAQQRYDEI